MNTKSIQDYLEIKFGYKEKYSLEELSQVQTLVINRFDYNKELIEVDFNDLNSFINLNELTLNECILGKEQLYILVNCINLKKLLLLNCEIVNDSKEIFSNLNLEYLVVNNTNLDLDVLKYLNLKKLVLSNIQVNSKLILNVDELDIQRCLFDTIEYFDIENINKLIISYSQFEKYENYLKHYNDKLIIM